MAFGVQQFPGTYTATALTNRASTEIQEYLAGKRTVFDIPLNPYGTQYQQKVWRALCSIPYGETRSYKEVARIRNHQVNIEGKVGDFLKLRNQRNSDG